MIRRLGGGPDPSTVGRGNFRRSTWEEGANKMAP
jgi:hypothetical protein